MKRGLKKITAVFVSACVIISTFVSTTFAVSPSDFSDINSSPAKAALIKAVENGLLAGNKGKIRPNDPLLRVQMAIIINRAFGATEKADISKFKDVSPKIWYAEDVAKAVKMGTFQGSTKNLAPEKAISREDAFTVVARAFKLTTTDFSSLDKFSDKAQISSYAKAGIAALAAGGYLSDIKGKLNPRTNITRAEFAVLMDKLVSTYIRTAGTYKTVAKGNVLINKANVSLKNVTITGDLIIADGVGKGNVTLDGVKVLGRTVVRGGGANSIHVINGSSITGTVIIDNVNNQVRIVTDEGTTIQNIEAGSQVVLEGTFGNVSVVGNSSSVEVKGDVKTLSVESKAEVTLTSGTIEKVAVAAEAADAKVTVAGATVATVEVAAKADVQVTKGTVTNVDIKSTAANTTVAVGKDAKIDNVVAEAKTEVKGEGTVAKVDAKANDVKVGTPGTEVNAAEGVTGVTAGDKEVKPGETAKTPEVAPTPTPTSTPPPTTTPATTPGTGTGPTPTPTPTPTVSASAVSAVVNNVTTIDGDVSGGSATINFTSYANTDKVTSISIVAPTGSYIVTSTVNSIPFVTTFHNIGNMSVSSLLTGSNADISLGTLRALFGNSVTVNGTLYCSGYNSRSVSITITLGGTGGSVPNEWADFSISGTTVTANIKGDGTTITLAGMDVSALLSSMIGNSNLPSHVRIQKTAAPAYDSGFLSITAGSYANIITSLKHATDKDSYSAITLSNLVPLTITFKKQGDASTVYTFTVVN